jgi:hypothetical protein
VSKKALVVGLAMLVAGAVSAQTPAEQLLCNGMSVRSSANLDDLLAKAAYEVLMNKAPVSADSSTVIVTCFDMKLEITPKMTGAEIKQVGKLSKSKGSE